MYQIKKRMHLLDILESYRQNIYFSQTFFLIEIMMAFYCALKKKKKNSCKLSSNIITNGMTTMQYVS